MKRVSIVFVFLLLGASAMNALTVEQCQQMARDNYPLIKRYGLIEKSEAYSLANASRGYLPQVSLSAQATYQSAVTEIPIRVPGYDIKPQSKDQYKAVLEVNQTIWDGGVIGKQRKMAKASSEVDARQADVDLYALNARVNNLYFGILLYNEQLEQNRLLQGELARSYNEVTAYIEHGVANQSDLDVVRVNQLNAAQRQTELEAAQKAYCQMLSYLIAAEATPQTLEKPEATPLINQQVNRPELWLMDAQSRQLEVQKGLLTAKNLFKLGAFIQGGYGRPGLNMLKDEFDPFYVAGVRLAWNFGGLYTQKNERRLLEIGQKTIGTQRETFLFNTQLELTRQDGEVEKLSRLMQNDDEIIRLRTNIRKTSEIKVANGTMTVTDMLRDLTAEDQARQAKSLHEMQLLMTVYEIKNTTNTITN